MRVAWGGMRQRIGEYMGIIAMKPKVHFLTGELKVSGAHLVNCGRIGWDEELDLDGVGEFTDELGDRFEATAKRDKVTCKVCRRIAGIK
jgi:hypothetical protein